MCLNVQEEREKDSVKLLKNAIEIKFNELTEINNRLKTKLSTFRSIFALCKRLSSVASLDSILENILLTCLEQLRAKGALIKIQSRLSDRSLSISKNKGMVVENNYELSYDSKFINYLREKNEPLIADQIEPKIRFTDQERKYRRGLKPEIIIPLVVGDNLRGVLFLSDKTSNIPYSKDDLEFLYLMSNQAALAVEILLLKQNSKNSTVELERTKKLLAQVKESAAVDHMVATIVQEVNNPLSIIKNYVTLLRQSLSKNAKLQTYLKVINEEVDRIAGIINRFLDFNRAELEVKTFTDIVFLLEDTFKSVEKQFSRDKVYIKKDFQKNIPKVKAFPEELKSVFLNILTNSKTSMPYGGEIEVSVIKKGNELIIEFDDTGIGIDGQNLSDAIDLFYTTDGKDLKEGLWVSKDIIRRHRGVLRIEWREDRKGTSYNINLPLSD